MHYTLSTNRIVTADPPYGDGTYRGWVNTICVGGLMSKIDVLKKKFPYEYFANTAFIVIWWEGVTTNFTAGAYAWGDSGAGSPTNPQYFCKGEGPDSPDDLADNHALLFSFSTYGTFFPYLFPDDTFNTAFNHFNPIRSHVFLKAPELYKMRIYGHPISGDVNAVTSEDYLKNYPVGGGLNLLKEDTMFLDMEKDPAHVVGTGSPEAYATTKIYQTNDTDNNIIYQTF